MRPVHKTGVVGTALAVFCGMSCVVQASPAAHSPSKGSPAGIVSRAVASPSIQIALLLDTSNSMDGLIEQAKSQLWKVVNEFTTARYRGRRPELKIALYEYGKDTLPAEQGYMRMIVPFTDDLDRVSEELFALRTSGGEEYCGQVIQRASRELAWSPQQEDLKLIFIAGNEPFTQGPVDYHQSVKAAWLKGITVNTIYCGQAEEGSRTGWKDGAILADGSYLSIDQNRVAADIKAPQDEELAKLGVVLNQSYVPFGVNGGAGQQRQQAQDANASGISSQAFAGRAISKASSYYNNASWDLVDALKKGSTSLDRLKDAELPEAMRKLSPAERKAYIATKAKERAQLQERITRLSTARRAYIATRARQAADPHNTLDSAMIRVAHEQAARRNFKFH